MNDWIVLRNKRKTTLSKVMQTELKLTRASFMSFSAVLRGFACVCVFGY